MKRCTALITSAFLAISAGFPVTSASAQTADATPTVRQFPKAAMRGEMVMQNHPVLTINGKAERLTPGARIFDKNNHLVLSGQLVGQEIVVNYLRDGSGQIHQVWILNSEEIKEKRAGSTSTIFNFITGSTPAADTTTSP